MQNNPSSLILALDQGTTSSRAVLFDEVLRPVASAQREFPQLYPHPGWVEHDPEALWQSQPAVLLEAAGRAAILIPSPNVAENHQYYNALELQKAGAAVVIEEKDLTGAKLIETVERLTADPQNLAVMGKLARSLAVDDSLARITEKLLSLVE